MEKVREVLRECIADMESVGMTVDHLACDPKVIQKAKDLLRELEGTNLCQSSEDHFGDRSLKDERY